MKAPLTNVILDERTIFPPFSAIMLPTRLRSLPVATDVLSESTRVRGVLLESGVARVTNGGRTIVWAHNATGGAVNLTKGTCLDKALAYPAPVEECDFPSFMASSLTHADSSSAFHEFSANIKPSLNATDYPDSEECLLQVLVAHSSVVALPGQPLGCTHLVHHKTEFLPETRPVYIPVYRLPHSQRKIASRKIREMLQEGIIESSTSPWNSPSFLVPKKDGDYKPVVDFRQINPRTVSQLYPLPVLTDLLQSLGEHNAVFVWFLASESRPTTAFSIPAGHFQYRRLPMGLKNSAVCFQILINEVFRGLLGKGVFAYLDGVVVVSHDMETHFGRLDEVFNRLSQAGLKVKLSKCHFL